MALRAGRVGVAPDQVDARGNIIAGGGGGSTGLSIDDIISKLNGSGLITSLVPFFTGATAPSGYEYSYSSQGASTTPAWALFNNRIEPVTDSTTSNVRWTTNQELPQYVQIKLPEKSRMDSFYISNVKPAAASSDYGCKAYKISGSNDGTTFTDIYEGEFENKATGLYVALEEKTEEYQYFRVTVVSSYNASYYGLTSFFPMCIGDYN